MIYAGGVTITKTIGTTTESSDSSTAKAGSDASLTIFSEPLASNSYYNGKYISNPGLGEQKGIVAGFNITANKLTGRTLPSGYYFSTVTLAYSIG